MKINLYKNRPITLHRKHGWLEIDLLVGMAIFGIAILPLTFSFTQERQVLRMEYFHSVAMEIVDGELEVLTAGDWKNFADGSRAYTVHANAADRLPPGHFQLIKNGNHLRLEWNADEHQGIGTVAREITVK